MKALASLNPLNMLFRDIGLDASPKNIDSFTKFSKIPFTSLNFDTTTDSISDPNSRIPEYIEHRGILSEDRIFPLAYQVAAPENIFDFGGNEIAQISKRNRQWHSHDRAA